jgi:hypothetical protein
MYAAACHHHHQITKLSHSINATAACIAQSLLACCGCHSITTAAADLKEQSLCTDASGICHLPLAVPEAPPW